MARTLGKIAHLRGDRGERFGLGIAYYRRDQPALERDRHTDVGMLEAENTVARPYRVGSSDALERSRPGLDDEIVERELERRLAILVLWRGGIGLLAHRDQAAGIEIGCQIKMRDRPLGFDQPRRDGAAHGVERHFLI